MTLRHVSYLLGFVAMVLLGLLIASTQVEGLQQFRTSMLIAAGVVAVASIVMLLVITHGHTREQAEQDARAESAFERQVMAEMGLGAVGAANAATSSMPPPPAVAAQGQATPEAVSAPEQPAQAPPAPQPDAKSLSFEPLLVQLRLAKLDPQAEGAINAGPHAGAAILRLAGGEVALATRHAPTPDEWKDLFPRYDRVFLALPRRDDGEEKWVCLERLEGLVRARLDISL